MDTKQFTEKLHKQVGLDKKTVAQLMGDVVSIIRERAVQMDSIAIQGFGTFESRKKNERISVSPTTGKRMLIPPKITVSFKPSVSIKNSLKELPGHE